MSTSATNRSQVNHVWREGIGLMIMAAFCIAVTNVYALFGHGIRSDAMDFMFLYPLCGAVVVLLLDFALTRIFGHGLSRLARNLINSGIATLMLGAMLRGILYIAGSSSTYAFVFPLIGWSLATAGAIAAVAIPAFHMK